MQLIWQNNDTVDWSIKIITSSNWKREWTRRKFNKEKQKESTDEQNLSNSKVTIFQN